MRSAMVNESNRCSWENLAANGNKFGGCGIGISSLGEAHGQSHVTNSFHRARNWKADHGEELAADLSSRSPTFCRDSAFVCNRLHLAILRQLHSLSPLPMSPWQLHAMMKGSGFLVGIKNLSNAVEELERAGQLERRPAADMQPRYAIVNHKWEDGRAMGR
jgi:hypothetical protein